MASLSRGRRASGGGIAPGPTALRFIPVIRGGRVFKVSPEQFTFPPVSVSERSTPAYVVEPAEFEGRSAPCGRAILKTLPRLLACTIPFMLHRTRSSMGTSWLLLLVAIASCDTPPPGQTREASASP